MISELKNNTLLIDIEKSKHVENIALRTLKPLIENWSHTTLSSDIVIFGVRRYLHGASLALHVDKLPTHVLSAILQVIQLQVVSL